MTYELEKELHKAATDTIYEYKKATVEDIEELVRTRMIVLRAANKLSDDVDMFEVEKQSYEYYKSALKQVRILHIWYMIMGNSLGQVV